MRMRGYIIYLLLFTVFGFFSCTEWDEYYSDNEASVNTPIWDSLINIDEFSEFTGYIKQYGLEKYLRSSNSKTLFIPANEAFREFVNSNDTTDFIKILQYHISPTLFPIRSVENYRKLLTYSGKYALIENINNHYSFDGIDVTYYSNLYRDGRYYKLSEVVKPKPNIYEYINLINPMIRRYIDTQDSIILDLEESTPIDFNESGQTIYDSVIIIKNIFEEVYFPVTEEFRERTATVLVPTEEQYNEALDDMALNLGGIYTSHEQIPDEWELNVLIPNLLNKGFYGGILDPGDFTLEPKIANIIGDSIEIDFEIDPESKFIASNGVAYKYITFSIDDSLYMGEKIIEGESLVKTVGLEKYAWNEELVTINGRADYPPVQYFVPDYASNDTMVDVSFEANYSGEYSIEITFEDVFPGEYQLLWRSNYRTSGVYSVYVNGEKPEDVGGFPHIEFDTYTLNGPVFSIILGRKFYPDDRGFNYKDFLVKNLTEYGDVVVKLEYIRQGLGTDLGFSLDYIALRPMSIAEQKPPKP